MFESLFFCFRNQDWKNLTQKLSRGHTTWKDMLENALAILRAANKKVEQLCKVTSCCLDDHHFKKQELESVGELSKVCSHTVLKCLYLAPLGRPDIVWSVNKLARSVTKWTGACDRRVAPFEFIHSSRM